VVLLPALVIVAGVIASAIAGGLLARRCRHSRLDAARIMPRPLRKVVRAAPPPPQRQAPGLPAAPRRELPGGLQLHVHGLSAEDAAARIARGQQDR
jgi:hypothetical protein